MLCADGRIARAQGAAETDLWESVRTRKILVLKKHGRVVTGDIQPRGNGYQVDQPNGQLFVASEEVWFLADSLPEAHQLIRDSFSSLTPDIHLRIASWCADNRLWGTARSELLDALHLDPYREEARRMLAEVVRLQNSATGTDSESDATPVTNALTGRLVVPRRSLGGLSQRLARDFAQHVQPLLSNKCAGCHGVGSGRTFVMESIRKGSTPAISERNLAAILRQLDPGTANQKQLMTMATTRHGGMKSEPFSRQIGEVQRERLSSWVEGVIQEKGFSLLQGSTSDSPAAIQSVRGFRDSANESFESRSPLATSDEFSSRDSDPHDSIRATDRVTSEMLADADRRNRIDRFDPGVFNRQFRVRRESFDSASGLSTGRLP